MICNDRIYHMYDFYTCILLRSKFGSRIYGGNLAVYIAFIIALSTYVVQIGLYKQSHFPEIHFIGFLRPSNVSTPIPTIVPSPSFIPFHDDYDNVSTVDIVIEFQLQLK